MARTLLRPQPTRTRLSSIQKLRKKVHLFLEWPSPVWSLVYHIMLCVACLAVFTLAMFCHERAFRDDFVRAVNLVLVIMELLMNVWIILDFVLRLWSSGCRKCFQGWLGKLKFCIQFLSVIDLIVIIMGFLTVVLGVGKTSGAEMEVAEIETIVETSEETVSFNKKALFVLILVQMLRFFKFTRMFGGAPRIIFSVMMAHKQVLFTILQIQILGFLMFAYFEYVLEMNTANTQFYSYSGALWWCIVTLTTVGYGDLVPFTIQGKAVAGFAALFALLMFFMPAVIIGTGIVERVKSEKVLKQRMRSSGAALIQAKWRMRSCTVGMGDHVRTNILFMKLLVALRKFQNSKKSDREILAQNVQATNSNEILCGLASRIILMEKSMTSTQAKLDQLLS